MLQLKFKIKTKITVAKDSYTILLSILVFTSKLQGKYSNYLPDVSKGHGILEIIYVDDFYHLLYPTKECNEGANIRKILLSDYIYTYMHCHVFIK